jgi:hypothetical protein
MRYYGKVGYFDTVETKPGLFEQELIFRKYKGDVLRNTKRNQLSNVNDDITISNSISIVADPYARDHFFQIKCAEWQGALWEVTSVDVQFPRLVLELGGVYHEDLE